MWFYCDLSSVWQIFHLNVSASKKGYQSEIPQLSSTSATRWAPMPLDAAILARSTYKPRAVTHSGAFGGLLHNQEVDLVAIVVGIGECREQSVACGKVLYSQNVFLFDHEQHLSVAQFSWRSKTQSIERSVRIGQILSILNLRFGKFDPNVPIFSFYCTESTDHFIGSKKWSHLTFAHDLLTSWRIE